MPLFARAVFTILNFASRRGLAETGVPRDRPAQGAKVTTKTRARQTGIRGETYAYWYLRKRGYVMVAKNYQNQSAKGELDMVGYDGDVLAFVEVKTRTVSERALATPEDAVTFEKRRNLVHTARRFLVERRIESPKYRFDVLAIDNYPGRKPEVRLHKSAFSAPI